MEINTGHQIQADLKAQGRSVKWFSQQMCCSRQNCYKIFKTPIPHLATIRLASKVLEVDYISFLIESQSKDGLL